MAESEGTKADETEALAKLNELLRQEFGDSFTAAASNNVARLHYVKAISELRPDDYSYALHDMQAAGKLSRAIFLKKQKQAAVIKRKFDALCEAWKKYDESCAVEASKIDEEMKRDLEETEDELADDWIVFAQLVREIEEEFKKVFDKSTHSTDDDDADDGDDSDMEMWMEEAKRLLKEEQKNLDAAAKKLDGDKPRSSGKAKRRSSTKGHDDNGDSPMRSSGKAKRRSSTKSYDSTDDSQRKSNGKAKRRSSTKSYDSTDDDDKSRKSSTSGKAKRRSSKTGLHVDDDDKSRKSSSSGKAKRRSSKTGLHVDDDDKSRKSSSSGKAKRRSSKTGLHVDDDDSKKEKLRSLPKLKRGSSKKSLMANYGNDEGGKMKRGSSKKGLSMDDDKGYSSPKSKKKGTWSPASPTKIKAKNLDGTPYISQFKAWLNEPEEHKEIGSQVQIPSVPIMTNFWCDEELSFDNGPYYWHKVVGDFQALVHVSGGFASVGDKAGLMARIDANTWMTSAIEVHNDGHLVHSTCITRHDISDVSYVSLDKAHSDQIRQGTRGLFISIKKIGSDYESYHSFSGQSWMLTRQGLFHTEAEWARLGVFCACPSHDSFGLAFDMYRCESVLTS